MKTYLNTNLEKKFSKLLETLKNCLQPKDQNPNNRPNCDELLANIEEITPKIDYQEISKTDDQDIIIPLPGGSSQNQNQYIIPGRIFKISFTYEFWRHSPQLLTEFLINLEKARNKILKSFFYSKTGFNKCPNELIKTVFEHIVNILQSMSISQELFDLLLEILKLIRQDTCELPLIEQVYSIIPLILSRNKSLRNTAIAILNTVCVFETFTSNAKFELVQYFNDLMKNDLDCIENLTFNMFSEKLISKIIPRVLARKLSIFGFEKEWFNILFKQLESINYVYDNNILFLDNSNK